MVAVSSGRASGVRSHAIWRVPRTRGVTSGVLLVLLGAWGALVPLIGPHFGYAYTPYSTWTVTSGRLWLEIAPGAVAVLGGLFLIGSASRAVGLWAGWLTALAGAWFVVGPVVSKLWTGTQPGTPVGNDAVRTVVEQLGFFTGLGVVIVFLAATALGRFSVIGVKETRVAEAVAEAAVAEAEAQQVADEEPVVERPVVERRAVAPVANDEQTTVLPKHAASDEPATDVAPPRSRFGGNRFGRRAGNAGDTVVAAPVGSRAGGRVDDDRVADDD
jgi:hypothetical protein